MIDCLIAVLLFVTAVMLPFRSIGMVTASLLVTYQGIVHTAYLVRAHPLPYCEVSSARMPAIASFAAHAVRTGARDCLGYPDSAESSLQNQVVTS